MTNYEYSVGCLITVDKYLIINFRAYSFLPESAESCTAERSGTPAREKLTQI